MIIQVPKGLLLVHAPHSFFLIATPGYLVEGPSDMRECQHEPMIEIGEAQESSKFSECDWGWPFTDDLYLGWIHMHTMFINDLA
jgi:hypothetical protein